MITGTTSFDGITIGELKADFMRPTVSLTAKAAFVNTKTGTTHGWTEGATWSPETMRRLEDLRKAMENDLARLHFTSAPIAVGAATVSSSAPVGLGEHVGDAPQI